MDREAIYFDGALPSEKRAVRLERLERARAQLENYRKQCPGPFQPSAFDKPSGSTYDLGNSIWKKKFPVPASRRRLPQPPFMVACVLDHLRHDSAISCPVQVVTGEADPYCAAMARATGAGILSSDSDMILYDLGSEGSLILLDTLDVTSPGNVNYEPDLSTHIVKAQRLHPTHITTRLGNTRSNVKLSLLRFAFERSRDPFASTSALRSRCIADPSVESAEAFERFYRLYNDFNGLGTAQKDANILVQLDPRLSELNCQFHCTPYMEQPPQGPHVYMPVIIEDPTRDSSWTYGKAFRTLAYSLLKPAARKTNSHGGSDCVIEFQRRGPRIVGMPLKLLNRVELLVSLETVVKCLRENNLAGDALLKWRLFGLKEVNDEKARKGKPTIPPSWAIEFLSSGYADHKLSWEDIHLYANMKAVLYSLWILGQACTAAVPQEALQVPVNNLTEALRSLVSLQSLMASRWEIPGSSQGIPCEAIAEALRQKDVPDAMPKLKTIDENKATGCEIVSGRPIQKATSDARNRRFRANRNIFEMLNSS